MNAQQQQQKQQQQQQQQQQQDVGKNKHDWPVHFKGEDDFVCVCNLRSAWNEVRHRICNTVFE